MLNNIITQEDFLKKNTYAQERLAEREKRNKRKSKVYREVIITFDNIFRME